MITPKPHGTLTGKEQLFADQLLASFDRRWERYRRDLGRCQKKCSEEAVHDLRVASRRLLSTLEVVARVVDDNSVARFRQTLRRRLKVLGPLRDVQVQLLRLDKAREIHPELEQFHTLLLLREKKLLKEIERELKKTRVSLLEQHKREIRTQLPRVLQRVQTQSAVKAVAIGGVAGGFLKASALLVKVDPSDAATIHRLRVCFKKFRYDVEALQHVLPGITTGMLKAMNEYQTRMGLIQDLEVFSAAFRKYLSRARKGTHFGFLPFQQELTREHQSLVEKFLAGAGELNGFWTLGVAAERQHKTTSSIHKSSLN